MEAAAGGRQMRQGRDEHRGIGQRLKPRQRGRSLRGAGSGTGRGLSRRRRRVRVEGQEGRQRREGEPQFSVF